MVDLANTPMTPSRPRPGESEADADRRSRQRMASFAAFYKAGAGTTFQQFVFKGVKWRRDALLRATVSADVPDELRRRLAHCADTTLLYRHATSGSVRARTLMCGSRWCPVCGPTSVYRLKAALFQHLHVPTKRLSFLTLAQPQRPGEPLKATLRRLREGFGRLRRSALWRAHVTGGLYVIECTRSKTYTDAYHVHLHMILDHEYMPLPALASAWERASGGKSLHITRVRHYDDVRRYISKYLSKPAAKELYADSAVLGEVIEALQGKPLLMLFGNWRGMALCATAADLRRRAKPLPYPEDEWKFLGSLDILLFRARRNDPRAQAILAEAGFGAFPLDLLELPRQPAPRSPPCRTQKTLPLTLCR